MATLKQVSLSKFDQACREASRSLDFTPVLKAIRVDVIAETRENFDKSSTADGKPWAPLKRPRPNSAVGGNDQPLRDFGILMASVTSPGAQGNVDEQSGRRIEWGTNLDYAAIHQYGGIITPKTAKFLAIPATVLAQRTGSPRNWPDGELKFYFGKKGGVAKSLQGEIQYYFSQQVEIPAREFLGLTQEQADEYGEWAADYAVEQVAKAFEGGG